MTRRYLVIHGSDCELEGGALYLPVQMEHVHLVNAVLRRSERHMELITTVRPNSCRLLLARWTDHLKHARNSALRLARPTDGSVGDHEAVKETTKKYLT